MRLSILRLVKVQLKRSYLNPKVGLKASKAGEGLFAKSQIKKDELIIDFSTGPGEFINNEKADQLFNNHFDYQIQIDENKFYAAINKEQLEKADFINHSCNPNCGIKDKLKIIALKAIKTGEEITYDYAMSESSNYKIKCICGAKNCRGTITGEDWKDKNYRRSTQVIFLTT